MTTDSLRICLLGLGRAGQFHLQSLGLTARATVSCVFDINSELAEQVARRWNCVAAPSASEAIQRDDVDAVIVATPTNNHFEFVLGAIEARKPVLTEKPLGRTLREVDQSFSLAAAASVPLFVAFQRRFDPSFQRLTRAVHEGEIGQLQFVRSVSRDNPVPSSAYIEISGGIFHDCMVHDLDMVARIVGATPTHVSAFASSFISDIGQHDDFDNVVANLAFPGGVIASIDINRKSVYGYDQRIEAFGDGGMVQADNRHETSVSVGTAGGFARSPIEYSFPTRYRDAYLAELESFVDCVRVGKPVPVTHQDVRVNHLLASGLERSARERRVVEFEEIEPNLEE